MSSNEALPSTTPRMKPLSKLRRLLGFKDTSRPNTAPGRFSSYTSDELDSKQGAGNAFNDLPVLDVRSDSRESHSLRHSISSPGLRKKSQALSPASNDADSPFLVISLLNDLEPSITRKSSKLRRPKTAGGEHARGASFSFTDSRSSLRRKSSKLSKQLPSLPTPDTGVIDISLSPEEISSRPKPLPSIPWNQAVDPVSPLSMTTFNSVYSHERALTSTTSLDNMDSLDQLAREDMCRKRSVAKIARTLGGCPPEYSRTIFADPPPTPAEPGCSFSPAQLSPPTLPTTKPKKTRRKSLTLPNLGSLPTLLRSNSQTISRLTRSSSRASLSTVNPDDVHKHNLADDALGTWGELRDDATGAMHTPISPILFNPPSPLPAPRQKTPWSDSNGTDASPSDTQRPFSPASLASPSAPPSRRHSLIAGRPRSQSFVPARSSQQFLISPRPRTPFDSYDPSPSPLPVKANWLDQVSSTLPSSQDEGRRETVEQPQQDPVSPPVDWSGEWNQSNMLDVVKALRNLK